MSALIKSGLTREILTNFKINFIFPEFEFKEILKHKGLILRKAGLSEKEFYILFLRLLKYVRVIPEDVVFKCKKTAHKIMGHIHKEDTICIATALAFN